jgi:lipoprotein-anchoring transpeptidase ErfK/SrfK
MLHEREVLMKKLTKKYKIIFLCTIGLILLIIYSSFSMYFRKHFYFKSVIDGVDVSGKTVEELDEGLSAKVTAYTLEFEERGNVKEQIKASDIDLKYDGEGKSQSIKDEQNSSIWISSLFKSNQSMMYHAVTYDEKLLKQYIDNLSCFKSSNIIEPKNASLVYTDSGYEIVKEVNGNKINKEILYASVVNAVLNGETKLDLESIKCYVNPTYNSDSQKVKDTKDILNKYIASKITYTYNGGTKVLDGSEIHDWIQVDENLAVTFDNKKVKSFVSELAGNYNTYGKKRDFTTSLGTTVKVSGGDYGWRVNVSSEANNIISAIKDGQVINRQPAYLQTAVSHSSNDIGNTYVEINLTKQHLWYYKNGNLFAEGDVVTGNASKHNSTPAGVYRLKYKEKNATLHGEDYSTPVTFWMPFNGNIGLHDASWRKTFGGEIYLKSGSHGCVNAPSSLANIIFNNISAGTPVVCYN